MPLKEVKLVLYIVGIYSVFIYWGYLQEKLISQNYVVGISATGEPITQNWNFACALNMCMAIACWVLSTIFEWLIEDPKRKKPSLIVFWKAAITSAMASPVGYQALQYINYPMMVLTKSSKPVPVMLVGIFMYNRQYPWYKYVSILMLVIGISMFTAFKSTGKYTDTSQDDADSSNTTMSLLFGISLVLINLTLDGYTNNEQDAIFRDHKASSIDMMKNVNLWQTIYLFSYLIITWVISGQSPSSELPSAYSMVMTCPEVQKDVLMFCSFAAVGQVLLFALVKEFGSLLWVTVSVTRKLFTVLVSVFIFNHSVNTKQWIGVVLVFLGLLLEIVMSYQQKDAKKKD